MKKMLDNDIFASGDEHEENNVPSYDLLTNICLIFISKWKRLRLHIQLSFLNYIISSISYH